MRLLDSRGLSPFQQMLSRDGQPPERTSDGIDHARALCGKTAMAKPHEPSVSPMSCITVRACSTSSASTANELRRPLVEPRQGKHHYQTEQGHNGARCGSRYQERTSADNKAGATKLRRRLSADLPQESQDSGLRFQPAAYGTCGNKPREQLPITAHPAMGATRVGFVTCWISIKDFDTANEAHTCVATFNQVMAEYAFSGKACSSARSKACRS